MHVFVTDIMNSYFFVTGQIGMKLGYENVNQCAVLNLSRRIMKISLKRVTLPPNRHFWVALTGLHVTDLQVSGYVFRLS